MLCFASMDAITKYIVHDYGVAQVLFVRSVVFLGLAALLAHRTQGLRRALRSRRPWLQFWRAALAVLESCMFVLAFRYLPLAGAAMWGLYQILIRLCGRTDSSETTLLWSAGVALLLTTFAGLPTWNPPSGLGWTLLIAISLLGGLGYLALTFALDATEAAAIQPYSYTLLVWVSVLGVLMFGDIPDGWTIAGGAIVVASGLFAWWRERVATRAATG